MHPGPDREQKQRKCDDGKRDVFPGLRNAKFTKRDESTDKHQTQDNILYKALYMRQMCYISEASAVHFRIEDDKDDCHKSKESLQREGSDGSDLPPYSRHEGGTKHSLEKSECNGKRFGGK